jgi:hypothetical protein
VEAEVELFADGVRWKKSRRKSGSESEDEDDY